MDGKTVLQIYDKMTADRGNMNALWADAVRFCFPWEKTYYDSYGMNDTTPGKRRAQPVCSTPVLYAQRLGSSLHNSAFPQTEYWFDFSFKGVDIAMHSELREWCRRARDIVHQKIRQGTNFYQESHAMMLGLAVLGTAGFYTYYKNGQLRFRYIPINKNFYIARNSDGDIDMAAILHEYTAKEAIEEYGRENVGKDVQASLMQGVDNTRKYTYVQLVYPKTPFGEKFNPLKGGKPYGDITVERETGRVVKISGHIQFPFAVPRFVLASDELYGRSPAMNAIADIRAINALKKTILDAALRAIKPALFVSTLINKPISVEAGALNRIPNFDPNSVWTYPSPTSFPVGQQEMAELQESLKHAFYIDVFQAIDQQRDMTATEITERVRQKAEAVAPIVSRLQREFSGRVVMQCLNLLMEHGEIPPPPATAEGLYFDITYESSIDAMIRQGIASKTMTFLNQAAMLSQLKNTDLDFANVINTDKVLQKLGDCSMLPAEFFRKPEEIEARRQQQAEAASQQAEAASQQAETQAELNLAKAQAIKRGGGYNGLN